MAISIVIPTYNEASNIGALLRFLHQNKRSNVIEIIVSDGGSSDGTLQTALDNGALAVLSPERGRAQQMNHGASLAKGDVLYFIHADTFPPLTFAEDIGNAIEGGYDMGRYKSKYLSRQPLLRLNEWFTRFDFFICMGGDQTLFVTKALFDQLGGFKRDMMLMEEYEFCKRARERGKYKIMNGTALISARKYEKNSWLQVQKANYAVVQLYKKGASQQELVNTYKRMLNW